MKPLLQFQGKIQLKGSWQDFLLRPTFIPWLRNVGKMFLLSERMLFYLLTLNFCNSECNHFTMLCFELVCLVEVCGHLVLFKVCWYWEIFHGNSPKKKASEYSKLSFFFYQTSISFYKKLKKQNNRNILTVQCLLGGHGNHSTKLFSNHKCCYNSQWPLTSHCFKHWCI